MRRLLYVLAACSLIGCASGSASSPRSALAAESGFEPLFDGHTLAGWRVVGGGATYAVEDGAIVGTVGPGPNTFLRTEREFGDFELRLEVRLEVPGNSGVQFRSHQRDDGRVYGYQCEIDPSERAWSGGIYDEGRRGWLASLADEPVARGAFRLDGWNAYVIRAEGARLRTWVNGVPCADLVDGADARGFVALQVHSGTQGRIRWRRIRLREIRTDAS
ncbi:MAG: DUF1080 domain-containing protein [Planctomycetes bacterium]|nr:DUF1080 domain-containing protein [Planctomycetota bacterium]